VSLSSEVKDRPKLKKGKSKVVSTKEDKNKKKRPNKQFITDFTDFLP
jgi:hypothetical protein